MIDLEISYRFRKIRKISFSIKSTYLKRSIYTVSSRSAFKCLILMSGRWKIHYSTDVEGVKFSHCRDSNGSANGRESNFVNVMDIYTGIHCALRAVE